MKKLSIIILIASISIMLWLFFSWRIEKKENESLKTIISSKDIQIGNNANQVDVWRVKYSDLENANRKQLSERSAIEFKLGKAYDDIEMYKRKEKDLIGYNSIDITSSDTVFLELPTECGKIEPIKTEHIDLNFNYNNSNELSNISYIYRANVHTVVMLMPRRKANGRKHFPNWGNLPWVGWETKSISTIDDKNATISNQVSIDFKK